MKHEYRFLALILVFCCMGFTLSACGKAPETSPTATVSTGSTGNADSTGSSDFTTALRTSVPTVISTAAPSPTEGGTLYTSAAHSPGVTASPSSTAITANTAQWVATELTFTGAANIPVIMDGVNSTFETAAVPGDWFVFGTGKLSTSTAVKHGGKRSLCLPGRSNSWSSPTINLYNLFKSNGPGTYTVQFWVYTDVSASSSAAGNIIIRGNAADENSFILKTGGNYYGTLASAIPLKAKTWTQFSASVTVLASDLTREKGDFNLMLGSLASTDGQTLYIDDFQISKSRYASAVEDVTLDIVFTGPGNTTIKMPAFWDGGATWKVRFSPTKVGLWTFKTICSDTANKGLHNITGTVNASAYTGSLKIYQHGFVKTLPNTRYFVYNDGTPFFYLGDTHWVLPHEKFSVSNAKGISSQFKYIVDKRVAQHFTVYQSEPIQTSHGGTDEAIYNLSDGLTVNDLAGFANLDRKFKYIADAGLVHANSQLFFASELSNNPEKYSDSYLEALSRYWVARYGAYPVLWTTAQEIDKRGPALWEKVMIYINKCDPYQHPSTAHQENASVVTASTSVYRDISAHTWYSPQWKDFVRETNKMYSFTVPRDYWENGQGKPVVNYEGCYEGFYTDRQGARAQGWIAYLNGMFGHGYGAAGIWNDIYALNDYGSGYLITGDNPGVNFDKYYKTWDQGIAMKGADDLGLMHTFFEKIDWWNLTPRFDNSAWSSLSSSWYALATKSNTLYVAYFYNSTTATGTLKGMTNTAYTAQWFNPATGATTNIGSGTITPSGGQWTIPVKPSQQDWVLIVTKK